MSVPEPPTLPALEKNPRRRRWKRVCLRILISLLILIVSFYWVEDIRGRRALEKIIAEYKAEGESLDPATFLTKAPPAAENFGATPLLNGILLPWHDPTSEGSAAWVRFRRLVYLPRKLNTEYTWLQDSWRNLTAASVDWRKLRDYLLGSTRYTPPASEPSDVRAVYAAMETDRALFEELIAAAARPHAVFTPAPAERELTQYFEFDFYSAYSLVGDLNRFILLRARAAAAMGECGEAANLARVLWRLREATCAEMGLSALNEAWLACVSDVLRSRAVDDPVLAHLQSQPGLAWSPEKEILTGFRGEAAYELWRWQRRIAYGYSDESFVMGGRHSKFDLEPFGPSGWQSQNAAEALRRLLTYQIRPLRDRGFQALPAASESRDKEASTTWAKYCPYTLWNEWYPSARTMQSAVFSATQIRLTLLALGMERYRLKHGRYPVETAALTPDFLAALPPDIDGAPLRIVTSPDGAKAVLYSIGWNLTDDWHGTVPAGYKEDASYTSDDWPFRLPFPPLQPP